MEKHILRWSYWLGLACFAIATAWAGLNIIGIVRSNLVSEGFGAASLAKGGAILLVLSIATANYGWFSSRNP